MHFDISRPMLTTIWITETRASKNTSVTALDQIESRCVNEDGDIAIDALRAGVQKKLMGVRINAASCASIQKLDADEIDTALSAEFTLRHESTDIFLTFPRYGLFGVCNVKIDSRRNSKVRSEA